jgi:hypothetical protein
MLKRFPGETFLAATCSGDLVRISAVALPESPTLHKVHEKLHLE